MTSDLKVSTTKKTNRDAEYIISPVKKGLSEIAYIYIPEHKWHRQKFHFKM